MKHLLSATALILSCAFGISALAQDPRPLRQIGLEPFMGDHVVACKLHATAQSLAQSEQQDCEARLTLLDQADDETCSDKPLLQDGTVWWMTFTNSAGQHRISLSSIAFGDAVAADDPRRMVRVCGSNTSDFVKPRACGNYARQVPVSVPKPKKVRTYESAPGYNAPLREHQAVQFVTYVYDRGICYPVEYRVDATGPAAVQVPAYPYGAYSRGSSAPYGAPATDDY